MTQIPDRLREGHPLSDIDIIAKSINQLIDWAHSVEERLSNQVVEKPEVFNFQADRPLNSERE